jgi:hypothetical protein
MAALVTRGCAKMCKLVPMNPSPPVLPVTHPSPNSGMCEGLGLGTNAMAALVTRGCTEMRKLVVVCGGESSTVFGLSGVGDTFGTCFGPQSRNRQVGHRIGVR